MVTVWHTWVVQPIWDLPLKAEGISIELPKSGQVRIRPVNTEDAAGLQAAYQNMSEQSRYFRFFNSRDRLSDGLANSLTNIDHQNHFAWVVFDPDRPSEVDDPSGYAVGAARLIRDADPTSAEAALAIIDEYQGRGVGRFLIDLLLATAADTDVTTLRFETLRQNRAMIGLLASMGGEGGPVPGDASLVEYRLAVPAAEDTNLPAGALYELLRHVDNQN